MVKGDPPQFIRNAPIRNKPVYFSVPWDSRLYGLYANQYIREGTPTCYARRVFASTILMQALAWIIREPRRVADTLSGNFIVFMNNAG